MSDNNSDIHGHFGFYYNCDDGKMISFICQKPSIMDASECLSCSVIYLLSEEAPDLTKHCFQFTKIILTSPSIVRYYNRNRG